MQGAPTTEINGQPLSFQSGPMARFTKERFDKILTFQPKEGDVYIMSYPKAGAHWIMDIATKLLLDGDMEKAARWARPVIDVVPSATDSDGLHEKTQTIEDVDNLPSPRILGSHLYFRNMSPAVQESNAKFIFLWRNFKDTAVSFYEMVKKMMPAGMAPPFEKFADGLLIPEDKHFGTWLNHMKSFLPYKDRENFLFLCYDDMKEDLLPTVRKVAAFLNKDVSEELIQTITASCDIDAAKKANPGSLFLGKGLSGRWKHYYTVGHSDRTDEVLKSRGMDATIKAIKE